MTWKRRIRTQNLFERWWLEHKPFKVIHQEVQMYRFGDEWPRKTYATNYKKKAESFAKRQYAYNKMGISMKFPSWGG